MQVSFLGGEALLGQSSSPTSTALGPMAGDATALNANAVPIANHGNGLDAEAIHTDLLAADQLPPHLDSGGPPVLAAPRPTEGSGSAMTGEPGTPSSGEPQSLYVVPVQK